MKHAALLDQAVASEQAARAPKENELALNVVTVYQDPLTRHWAAELWDRVGRLIDSGGISRKSWNLGELTQTDILAGAVQAATEAHVLVVSVRDAGQLPASLSVWIDAWVPNRAGLAGGALVALIGLPPQPDSQSGRAYAYLESVAKRAGLDFLPNERKLPPKAFALPTLSGIMPTANITTPWPGGVPGQGKVGFSRRG
jgi:hypothetical protein